MNIKGRRNNTRILMKGGGYIMDDTKEKSGTDKDDEGK